MLDSETKSIGIIGAGSWGTALAWHLSHKGHNVTMWSSLADEIDDLIEHREHKKKLPGVILPENVSFTSTMSEAIDGKTLVIVAVPSPYVRSTAQEMNRYVADGQVVVNVAKGIEESTLKTLSAIIKEEIPQAEVAVLTGPTHAEEVGAGMPTAIVAGCRNHEVAKMIQDIFMSESLRVYSNTDVLGMETGAALKNVMALAAGVADGIGCGDNLKAALITRGIHEMVRLGVAMGCSSETFYGLTGLGDLIVTCASMHSRNRRAGILIGQGKSVQEAMDEVSMVVEGVYAAKAALELARKYGVELPIVEEMNKVLFEDKNPHQALTDLMKRSKKPETDVLMDVADF